MKQQYGLVLDSVPGNVDALPGQTFLTSDFQQENARFRETTARDPEKTLESQCHRIVAVPWLSTRGFPTTITAPFLSS